MWILPIFSRMDWTVQAISPSTFPRAHRLINHLNNVRGGMEECFFPFLFAAGLSENVFMFIWLWNQQHDNFWNKYFLGVASRKSVQSQKQHLKTLGKHLNNKCWKWRGLGWHLVSFKRRCHKVEKPERTDMNPAFFWLIYLTSSSVWGPYMSQILLLRTSMPLPGCCNMRCHFIITLSLLQDTSNTAVTVCVASGDGIKRKRPKKSTK